MQFTNFTLGEREFMLGNQTQKSGGPTRRPLIRLRPKLAPSSGQTLVLSARRTFFNFLLMVTKFNRDISVLYMQQQVTDQISGSKVNNSFRIYSWIPILGKAKFHSGRIISARALILTGCFLNLSKPLLFQQLIRLRTSCCNGAVASVAVR